MGPPERGGYPRSASRASRALADVRSFRQQLQVDWAASIRTRLRAARRSGASWVRCLDVARLFVTGEGRARLWTRLVHRRAVHQSTPFTSEERYPELFDLAAKLAPNAERILSFGCSTGEELDAIRRRFPLAEIVGAEINPRSRRIAARRVDSDERTTIVSPKAVSGSFDVIFALAVLQREPHTIEQIGSRDISGHYPFARFDAAVSDLASRLREKGLLCVIHAQYRVEDSSAARQLHPVEASPMMEGPLFGPDGKKLELPVAKTMFRKRG